METELKYFIKLIKQKLGMHGKEPVGDQKYFFIHIPKTGGTSFLFTLYDHFSYRSIFPRFQDYVNPWQLSYIPAHEFRRRKMEYLNQHTKIICGHFPFWYKDVIGSDVKTLVFFREPKVRFISDVLYLKHHVARFKKMSFEEILAYRKGIVYNKQAALFGYSREKDNIKEALQRLNNCSFVGITEEYRDSVRLCNKIFGWSLSTEVKKNKRKEKSTYGLDDLAHLIQDELLDADRIIYEAAKKRFHALKKQYGI